MSSLDYQVSIWDDFNVHVDVPNGDGIKFLTVLDSCNLQQLVTKPTYVHEHTLDLILVPQDGSCSHNMNV